MNSPQRHNLAVPRVLVLDHAGPSPSYPAASCIAAGDASGRIGRGHSMWAICAELAEGAELSWGPDHGDEVIYLLEGILECAGERCANGGSIVVEAGVPVSVRARSTARIVHFGPSETAPPVDGPFGPPGSEGRSARVVEEDGSNPVRHVGPDGVIYDQNFYADGTSPTSRLALFRIRASGASEVPVHSHTQDEIIHVLKGEIRVGKLRIEPGMSIAIKADQRYAFSSPGPLEFLNYRRDASWVVIDDKPPMLEVFARDGPSRGID